jgi:hypothetical protein
MGVSLRKTVVFFDCTLISFQGVQKESGGQKIRTAPRRNLPDKEFVIELEDSLIPDDTSGSTSEEKI